MGWGGAANVWEADISFVLANPNMGEVLRHGADFALLPNPSHGSADLIPILEMLTNQRQRQKQPAAVDPSCGGKGWVWWIFKALPRCGKSKKILNSIMPN